ncbi:unnamed protein product [Microthlaspi erraticum]|uniref:Uncharacterized protein n=1 Tax=Microthlaspi erraticum TaxID=1685480 RepID=A0A6D2JTW2_9BRAS|nr:unnamed protein product [Microthlaspi erraticum]
MNLLCKLANYFPFSFTGSANQMALSQNSVSSSDFQGILRYGLLRTYPGNQGVGIPKVCRCGEDVAHYTTHDGKKFFGCTGNTMDGQQHLNAWWEEAITEQLDEVYDELDDMNTQLFHIAMD